MTHTLLNTSVVAFLVTILGCGAPADTNNPHHKTPSPAINGHDEHGNHKHGDHDHGGDHRLSDMEQMKVELARLAPADAASAEKQHLCPVTGEMLGTMGAPIKVDVNGQEVWICCQGCRDALLEDPSKYLAKLNK